MQTFLPFADFTRTAESLDWKRLGKQRVETMQVVKAITTGSGWVNHPATKMWHGHLGSLVEYQRAVCHEWVDVLGYRDTCLEKTLALVEGVDLGAGSPAWLGRRDFHRSHQSNLVRKDPVYYSPLFPGVPPDLPYIWPST
jgi:hypothetical protein